MYKLWPRQAQYMASLTFIWPLWPWPSNIPEKIFQMAFLLLEGNNCAKLFWNPCINVQVMLWTSSIHVYDHFYLYLTPVTLTFNLPKNVSNDTSPSQGQQLCQIVLKSMHYCTSYGPDKCGWTHGRTHIHRTKIVTTACMSRLPASGLDNKKGWDLHRGIFVNFHQKLVVYYVLDYFGILFILDKNSVLREFIL